MLPTRNLVFKRAVRRISKFVVLFDLHNNQQFANSRANQRADVLSAAFQKTIIFYLKLCLNRQTNLERKFGRFQQYA